MNIILFGPAGSGKGTQAELLSKELSLFHFSMGDVLRAEIAKNTVLGKEVLNHDTFGFPSRRMLEEAITSFCIGERIWSTFDDTYIWRNGDCKNEISNHYHGDLHFFQIDVSGNERKGLFWNEYDCSKDVRDCSKGINSHHGSWGDFLMVQKKSGCLIRAPGRCWLRLW